MRAVEQTPTISVSGIVGTLPCLSIPISQSALSFEDFDRHKTTKLVSAKT
jgi:hypothetical protein